MSEPTDALHERVPGLFEPDTMLASQYFDRLRRRSGYTGEWLLMVAILEDAVNVYLKHAAAAEPSNQQLFDEAEQWIEEHDSTWIFSFESICDMLELEADYLRRGLRAAKARARSPRTDGARVVMLPVGEGEQIRRASNE